ncbi:MAG: SUMF1/EgtB/PvdO family nonheme iron enzyme [Gemmatimonadetes bacterium]|nr:SUMF1/EgtB/PvdO family nonheme iron enzyme [Gemmatimonadota bacterium]
MRAFSDRFSERKVAQWAIGYLAVAWGGLQVLQLLWEVFEWPLTPLQVIVGVVAVGFPVVVGFAWVRRPSDGAGTDPASAPRATGRNTVRTLVSVGVVVGLVVAIGWTVSRSLDRRWARGEAVLEISQLADAGEFAMAIEVSERALDIVPDLPVVDSLINVVSQTPSIESEPAGANVFFKEYSDPEGPWIELGLTPISDQRVPRGPKRFRLVMEGYESLEVTAGAGATISLPLPREGSIPEGMVRVSGGTAGGFITSIGPLVPLPYGDYFIDRYEVSNEQFHEFVEAGGYEREDFWTHEFVDSDRRLSWSEAMERFEDATGRSGPATWELGRPKRGEEALPVTGVSWYEAAAYAEFRGKSLPTLRHWVRAAGTGQGGSIIPLSNFDGNEPAPSGTFQGMSPSGTFDMAGNVREWLLNSAGGERHAVGGAWSDPAYFFSGPNVQSPFDRLPVNGFRLAQYTQEDDFGGEAEADMPLLVRNYNEERPVSDEVFRAYANQFDYDPAPLNAVIEERLEYDFGSVEIVSFDGVGWGRIHAFLYLPAASSAPYQTVVWFPGSNAAIAQADPDPRDVAGGIEHFVASGRAVLRPITRGTYSRADPDQPPGMNTTWPKPTREYVDLARSWVSETRRSVDYLESRPEIDVDRIAYYGTSWGGRLAAIIPAVEPRFRLNLVIIGGLASGLALAEVDQINFVSRITVPTLMLNGRHDPLEPVEDSQLPMFRLLGTPEADKRHVIYEGFGHGVPRNERIAETLDWLDKYFGPPR